MTSVRMGHGRIGWPLLVWLVAVFAAQVVVVTGKESESTASSSEIPKAEEPAKPVEPAEEEPAFLAAEKQTWGTYYDPKGQFCGQYDCYSIFGFDYEQGSPDEKEIIKRYRRLGRKWHPDKSKHPQAKERFVVSLSFHSRVAKGKSHNGISSDTHCAACM
jgi:DnaJ domain